MAAVSSGVTPGVRCGVATSVATGVTMGVGTPVGATVGPGLASGVFTGVGKGGWKVSANSTHLHPPCPILVTFGRNFPLAHILLPVDVMFEDSHLHSYVQHVGHSGLMWVLTFPPIRITFRQDLKEHYWGPFFTAVSSAVNKHARSCDILIPVGMARLAGLAALEACPTPVLQLAFAPSFPSSERQVMPQDRHQLPFLADVVNDVRRDLLSLPHLDLNKWHCVGSALRGLRPHTA
eukprot:gene4901-5043_t